MQLLSRLIPKYFLVIILVLQRGNEFKQDSIASSPSTVVAYQYMPSPRINSVLFYVNLIVNTDIYSQLTCKWMFKYLVHKPPYPGPYLNISLIRLYNKFVFLKLFICKCVFYWRCSYLTNLSNLFSVHFLVGTIVSKLDGWNITQIPIIIKKATTQTNFQMQ